MNKTPAKNSKEIFDDINDFESLLEEDLKDIESFLDSYIVKKVDEEKIDLTIETLREYMPEAKVNEVPINQNICLVEKIKNNIKLLKMQFKLFNKMYLVLSLLLTLIGVIGTIKCKLNPYLCVYIISPIPILLGLVEILRGKEDGIWELELSFKYSFREIIFSKLLIIGLTSIAISLMMSLILVNKYSQANLLRLINISLIPICAISIVSLITASICRGINSISLSSGIWIICSSVVSGNDLKEFPIISDINLLIILITLLIVTMISLKVFYRKSINFIDYKKCEF